MANITSETVLEILNEILAYITLDDTQLDVDLTELGLDSIMFVQIIVALENAFNVEISDSKLMIGEMNTVNKMLKALKDSSDE